MGYTTQRITHLRI